MERLYSLHQGLYSCLALGPCFQTIFSQVLLIYHFLRFARAGATQIKAFLAMTFPFAYYNTIIRFLNLPVAFHSLLAHFTASQPAFLSIFRIRHPSFLKICFCLMIKLISVYIFIGLYAFLNFKLSLSKLILSILIHLLIIIFLNRNLLL